MTEVDQTIDQAAVGAFVERALGVLVGAGTAQLAHLGDKLGLYRSLARQGPATSAEHAVVLAADDSSVALAGAFEAMAGWQLDLDDLATAFRTGRGIEWGRHDERVHHGTTRFFGAAYRNSLVSERVPALGQEAMLQEGALVADVGCGHGMSTVLLAKAYPNSRFLEFDTHVPSLEAARRRADEAGVGDRVTFETAEATSFDGGPYDVIGFFDCLHDLGDPVGAAGNAHRNLAAEGIVALVEPFAHDEILDNLTANPGAGLHYTASTFLCVPHSLSEPEGAALGGQAGGRRLADTLRAGGLTHTEPVAATPIHAVYAARP